MPYSSWLPILLGVLSAVGPLSTDMYLPAFPAIEAALGDRPGTAQLTLATWFAGLAIGQLTQGSLADRYGRRGPLLAGTVIYAVASAGCALSTDIATLSLMRFLAAFGGSASMVIPRAVVRDLAEGHAAARLMAKLILVMGAAPILAPTLGGLVLGVWSWHAIFWLTTAYGLISCVLVWATMPETLSPARRLKLPLAGIVARFALVGRDRVFLSYALMGGFGMFGMFSYIGGSPPVLIEMFGFTPPQYGMLFGASAFMFIAAAQISPRLLHRYSAAQVVRFATRTYAGAALVMLGFALMGRGGWPAIVLPAMVSMGCMGFIMPNAAVGALSRHAAQAGSASALMGTLQFTLAACSGVLVGVLADGSARPMAALVLLGAVGACLSDLLRPPAAPAAPVTARLKEPAA